MTVETHQRLARDLLSCDYADLNPIQRSVIDLIATEAPSNLHPKLLVVLM